MNIKQISVICYGNIARSQILGIYLNKFLKEVGIKNIEVYSAGTAPYEAYPDTPIRMREVEKKLIDRGVNVKPKRNYWTEEVRKKLESSDIILVADEARKKDILDRLGNKIPKDTIYKFYEFIDREDKDFEDTYDYEKRCQDPIRFEKCFEELERIARKIVDKIKPNMSVK